MQSTPTLRRSLAALAAILAGVLTLAACGTADNSGGDSKLSDGEVTLRVTWWGADNRHKRTADAIKTFEKKHPNIHVQAEFVDWSGYWDKLATSTAGGNAPDVMQLDQIYLASYADRGVLADLERLSQLRTSDLGSALDMGRSNGTLHGMPISTTPTAVLVNQDKLDELGLKLPDTNTWTWQQFNEFARSVTMASGGKVVGIGPWSYEFSLQLYARQRGESLFTDGQVSISSDTLAGFYQQALDWTTSGAARSASQIAEQTGVPLDQTDMATGKSAMAFVPATTISAYSAASGGANLQLVKLPTDDANARPYMYLKPGMYWAVSSRSKHPAEAALLVDFLVNNPEAATILGMERGIPANPKIRDSLAQSLSPNEQKAVAYVRSLEKNLGKPPEIVPNGASDIDPLIQRYLMEVLFKRQTPKAAAEGLIKDLRSSIDAAK
ncbi:ABC transporter substrate-binding protein [Plantactinospora sp. CA-294935]|uniref:ABC transporter substrate-binding protein n=1 Tax=Plantactinospora sp. CA-294935 TaxID=3240012 RepID=UPI003D8D20B3